MKSYPNQSGPSPETLALAHVAQWRLELKQMAKALPPESPVKSELNAMDDRAGILIQELQKGFRSGPKDNPTPRTTVTDEFGRRFDPEAIRLAKELLRRLECRK